MKAHRSKAQGRAVFCMLGVLGLAIAAAIALVAGYFQSGTSDYREYTLKSKFSKALAAANNAMTSVEGYYMQHDAFPSSNAEAGCTCTSDWKDIQSVSIGPGGVVSVTFSAAVPEFNGQSAVYTPSVGAGNRVTWKGCSAIGIPERYWPRSCR